MSPVYRPRLPASVRFFVLTIIALAATAAAVAPIAHAQAVANPAYWKETAEHRDTVYRFFYRQSPQSIPAGYDPVAEAEGVLRQRQAALPASSPEVPSLWQRIRTVPVKAGLSTPLRAMGTIGLVVATGEVGWRIGGGLNAKFLRIGLPGVNNTPPATLSQPQLQGFAAGAQIFSNAGMAGPEYAPFDGFAFSWYNSSALQRQKTYVPERANPTTLNWIEGTGFPTRVAPAPTNQCRDYGTSVYHQRDFTYQFLPEESLPSAGPIEDFTGQPYDKASPAPTPPPQSTVEQSIEDELAKPENDELRQWLNYELGSPGERDPLGIGPPNASQETLDRTAQLLDSQDTQEKKATGSDTIRNCRVPLWHYTSSANAASIYASKAIRASDEAGVGAPPGAYATTITPLDPGPPGDPWTQVSLAYHLFVQLRPVDGWVLLCSNDNSHFKPVGGLAPADYWYAPGEADTDVPVEPQAWGVNPMPAE